VVNLTLHISSFICVCAHFPSSILIPFPGPGWCCVFPLHALMFACMFIVVHPCFSTCQSFTLLLQKFRAPFHMCLCSSVSCFATHLAHMLWYLRSSCVTLIASGLLNQSLNSFSTVCHSWHWMAQVIFITYACSATLKHFHLLVHLPLHSTVFSMLC